MIMLREIARGLVLGVLDALTAVRPPAPIRDEPGLAVWDGGLVLGGPLLRIPGRALNLTDPEQLQQARQHAASVTAALARHERDAAGV